MSQEFELDPRLAADAVPVVDLVLSRVLLMDDARFAWALLVPRRAGAVEWIDLDPQDQSALWREIAATAQALRTAAPCDKLNIGALGNVVAQLHVHVVARRLGDPAWPGPVWGSGPRQPYEADAREALLARLRAALMAG